jgi:outer membrane immunogenic protein
VSPNPTIEAEIAPRGAGLACIRKAPMWTNPIRGFERSELGLHTGLYTTQKKGFGGIPKKLFLMSATIGALLSPARGGDYDRIEPKPIASSCFVAPRVCTNVWPGLYGGVNAGYAFGANDSTISSSNTFVTPGSESLARAIATLTNFTMPSTNVGFIGGGQVGYNFYQGVLFGTTLVAGVEADIQAGPGKASSSSVTNISLAGLPNQLSQTASVSSSIDYLGTVRTRLGMVVGLPETTVLLYMTGGIAYAGASTSTNITQSVTGPPAFGLAPPTWTGSGRLSGTSVGFAAGLGAEWLFLPSWSTGVEWLYYDVGSPLSGPISLVSNASSARPLTVNTLTTTTPFRGDILRASINYHF